MRREGFSLVELLVVVGILALLASLLVFNASGLRARAREEAARAHGGTVAQAVRAYLAVWITDTPAGLMARLGGRLPPADWTGAPAGARAGSDPTDRSCGGAFALVDPSGNPTPHSWPAAPSGVGCVLGLRNEGGVSRLRAITWARGSSRYYVDGQAP